ncbi:MAG TPA: AI-2E family transporter [Candidatus Binatia bacterium]|nr:AI-2E family transporter [Candidatus Binatia bacterium]
MRFDKRSYRNLVIAVGIALVFGAYFLRNYIPVILLSAIIAFIFSPLYQRFLRRYKRPGISATLTFLVSLIVIIIPLVLICILTVIQIRQLLDSLANNPSVQAGNAAQSLLNTINSILAHIPGTHPLTMTDVSTAINNALTNAASKLLDIITSSVGSISRFITELIIYIYLFVNILMHQETLLKAIKGLNPLGSEMSDMYLQKMGSMTTAMAKGQFIIAAMQGTESAAVLYLVGFHNLFLFFLIFLSFLSLIPLGAGIVTIPIGIGLILTGNIWQGVVVIANHLLIVTNIDNVVRPRLVPKNASLNSALTILSVFAGVAMFGFLGIIIGPVIMIVIVSTIQVYLAAREPYEAS